MTNNLLDQYRKQVQNGARRADIAQEKAAQILARLSQQLVAEHQGNQSRWRRLFARPQAIKGLYFWGGVGRGKTWLMDLFFEHLPISGKQRLHFHRFMYWLHGELKQHRGEPDPVRRIIAEFARETRVLCFDEFFVSDIGDAMLLAAVLESLFEHGVTLVATSNIPPHDLYRNGLQRDNFLPAIALIEKHCEIMQVDGGTDYRLREMQQHGVYLTPNHAAHEKICEGRFQALCGHEHAGNTLTILDRAIHVRRWSDGVAWFDFSALCMGPRSQADYIELARSFHTILISNMPALTPALDDAARRFIALVDEFYERKVKLTVVCDVELDAIYTGELLKFPFERTCSRLQEMQTETYLQLAHTP